MRPRDDFIAAIANGLPELVEAGARAYETPFLDSAHRLAEKFRHLLFCQEKRRLVLGSSGVHVISIGCVDGDQLRSASLIKPAGTLEISPENSDGII